ncbi:MAG: hypothetical protein ACRDNS_34250, partial [Trebonia sp.]
GARMRRLWLVGFFTLVLLALAMHVTAARAVTTNTITQTAITSPADPSYFYDATGGAYGGITLTGTTNSTDPSSDTVDIDCYDDDGNTAESDGYGDYYVSTLATVPLDASGGFSATIPYATVEQASSNGECRLRAVPAGTTPTSDLSSFAGPRILLASLDLTYTYGPDSDEPNVLGDYQLTAPQLGAVDSYYAASDPWGCGLGMSLASTQYFSDTAYPSFDCSDPFENGYNSTGNIEVDGQQTYDSYLTSDPITVSVTQDPTNGDITVHETEPLDVCSDPACDAQVPSGVQDERTIQQAGDGRVVLISDEFVSTDGAGHQVSFWASSMFDEGVESAGGTDLFGLPGQSGYSSYSSGETIAVGSGSPGTIYGYNDTNTDGSHAGYDALTYFTAPSGPVAFAANYACCGTVSTAVIPFTVDVPAGGSQSVSLAYASEYSQSALAGDLQTELNLQAAPTVTISSPSAGATVSTASVTVSGSLSAFTDVKTVTVNGVAAAVSGSSYSATVPLSSGPNTLTVVVTTYSGITASASEQVTYAVPPPPGPPSSPSTGSPSTGTPSTGSPSPGSPITPALEGWTGATWLPIADTGRAHRAGARREVLHGKVTAGSGGVSYYFQYGQRGHLNHRSKVVALAASKTSHGVALTIGGLNHGTTYAYRLVATGEYGHATGRKRSFKTTARKK